MPMFDAPGLCQSRVRRLFSGDLLVARLNRRRRAILVDHPSPATERG